MRVLSRNPNRVRCFDVNIAPAAYVVSAVQYAVQSSVLSDFS